MLTRWNQFPALLPFGAGGALVGALIGWLLSRFVRPPRRRLIVLALTLFAAAYAQTAAADLDWRGWADATRHPYLVGGLQAVLLAWAITALLCIAVAGVVASVTGRRKHAPPAP